MHTGVCDPAADQRLVMEMGSSCGKRQWTGWHEIQEDPDLQRD